MFVVLQTAGKVKQRCREMYSASRYGSEQLVLAQVLTEFSEKDVSKYFTMCGFSHSGAFDPFKNHDIFLKEAHLLQSKKKEDKQEAKRMTVSKVTNDAIKSRKMAATTTLIDRSGWGDLTAKRMHYIFVRL